MSTTNGRAHGEWFKSSYSGNPNGECVEACPQPAAIYIRDSKRLDELDCPVLSFSPAAWSTFTAHTSGR
ncbi:DUF397 domain-containing protein [Streptomyces polychromogenes]|uniref:DUF397 domain-containing protein n=1 Tax=Streptomyces polychromogenes TaxID=67342 RepID=A0ABP3EQ04_9ACTN